MPEVGISRSANRVPTVKTAARQPEIGVPGPVQGFRPPARPNGPGHPFLALQHAAGNRAVTRAVQRTAGRCGPSCSCDDCRTENPLADVQRVASIVVPREPTAQQQAGEWAGKRAVAGVLGARRATAVIQRDAAAAGLIREAVNKPDPQATGGGYQEAFRVLNGLPMYDMLSTLTALRRSGQFDNLNANFKWAAGVNVGRLHVAFEAVLAKGSVDAEAFVLRYKDSLGPLPSDQRQDIIKYLDPTWFDSLKATEDAEALITAIRATAAFKTLESDPLALAEEIIAESRKEPTTFVNHMTKLKLLFDTKVKSADVISGETQASTAGAVSAEQKRLAKPAEAKQTQLEEKASGSPRRKWVAIPGKFGGGVYYVDRTSLANIVVKARVFLKPAGKGTDKDVERVRRMEDGIEKAASTKGYLVDVVFVKSAAADKFGNPPFTVEVDPGKWEVATNWAGGDPVGFAHELHHLFAFELDRYDYIEAHADNESMEIADRLHWFREELKKPAGYNSADSIMNNAPHPNGDDVCRVAGLDPARCVALREKKSKTP
ncbi:hypothetical protein BBK14_21595 [Parafrankia soli]|uniref:Uncharacterized protein n=1 Tax=Parafrankia soli TaxID=2599596 RepID=A0A1S1PWP1_9ACTN|nr:hypothetical protein BBK14_21595 [Parafrankia soli]